ncbi:MAG TPA: biopolymer transporter ExbD [Pseudomonadales bacterium]
MRGSSNARVPRGDDSSDINLTPMLDVVFIMLIFFIVTATFIKDPGIDVFRPTAETGVEKPTVSVLVAIGPNGEIWIDRKQVEEGGVRAAIERIHAENPAGGLVVQADKAAKYSKVKAVLEAARAAGIEQVAVSTVE